MSILYDKNLHEINRYHDDDDDDEMLSILYNLSFM